MHLKKGQELRKIFVSTFSEVFLPALSSVETSQAQFAYDKPHFCSYSVSSQVLPLQHFSPSKPVNYNTMITKNYSHACLVTKVFPQLMCLTV